MAGFPTSVRLAAVIGLTRPNRIRERWARVFALTTGHAVRPAAIARPDRSVSRHRLPFYAGPELHAERAIHMADSFQSASVARVNLARPEERRRAEESANPLRPSLPGRSRPASASRAGSQGS